MNGKRFALAGAIVISACVFLTTIAATIVPGYAGAFLNMLESIYPGYDSDTLLGAFVGLIYSFVDVFVIMYVWTWIYHKLETR